MNLGWIKICRDIQDHWVFKDPFYRWWSIVLFQANHKDNKITLGYNLYHVRIGECANSIRTWANLFNCSTKQVEKFFKMLENDKMITRKVLGKGKQSTTLINITNYSKYQHKNETQSTTQGTTQEGTQGKREGGTTKELKEGKQLKEKIEDRKLKFSHALKPFVEIYGKDMLNDFYKYWTEPNKSKTKFKQELEKTWSLERRLETWKKNEKNFKPASEKRTASAALKEKLNLNVE